MPLGSAACTIGEGLLQGGCKDREEPSDSDDDDDDDGGGGGGGGGECHVQPTEVQATSIFCPCYSSVPTFRDNPGKWANDLFPVTLSPGKGTSSW